MAKLHISDYDSTAVGNSDVGGVNIADGSNMSAMNNAQRERSKQLSDFYDDIGGSRTATGTAGAIIVAGTTQTLAAGQPLRFIPSADNPGATTLNWNSLGIKDVKKTVSGSPVALIQGDIKGGEYTFVIYDGTQFILVSPDTDIASLTPTDGNFIVGDGTKWVAESGAIARASLGAAKAPDASISKIHQVGWVHDSGIYTTAAIGSSALGPIMTSITPSNVNTRLLIWCKGEIECAKVGGAGSEHGVQAKLGYYDGTAYVGRSQIVSSLHTKLDTSALTVTRRSPYSQLMILEQAHLRSDTGVWLARILYGAVYASSTAKVSLTEFMWMEVE